MQLEFFGVRGSVPAPGPETAKYGGNTSCVHIQSKAGTNIILDAGTGIIKLGDQLLSSKEPSHILLTHNHWDHIQGFPFFKPIYKNDRIINVYPGQVESLHSDAVLTQMEGSTFPVNYQDLPCQLNYDDAKTSRTSFQIDDVLISTKPLNHPGGGTAYLVECDGVKVAYVTDNELKSPNAMKTSMKAWQMFVNGADLLIHDAQFLDEEMPDKLGWGHSTINEVLELAMKAHVSNLALISHDPCRTDDCLDSINTYLNDQISKTNSNLIACCAYEGQVYKF